MHRILALQLMMSFGFLIPNTSYAACKTLTSKANLCDQYPNYKHMVFFASWCSGCKDHIESAKLGETLFINVYDEVNSGAEALAFLLKDQVKNAVCIRDHQDFWAKKFSVKNLPYKTKLNCSKEPH